MKQTVRWLKNLPENKYHQKASEDIGFSLWTLVVIVWVCMVGLTLGTTLWLTFTTGKMYLSNGQYGYIDKRGKFVIAPRFQSAGEFSEGLAPVVENEHQWSYGYVDILGRTVIKPQFEEARPFHEGLAAVVLGGKLGYINHSGKFTIMPQFDVPIWYAHELNDFNEGRAVVYINKKCGLIDKSGAFIVEPSLEDIEKFSEHLALFARNKGLWGYMDLNGHTVIEPQFKHADSFSENLAPVQIGETEERDGYYKEIGKVGRWGYIDKAGKIVLSAPNWAGARNFHDGIAPVSLRAGLRGFFEYSGCIDKTGKFVVEPKFDTICQFHDGLAKMQIGRNIKLGYINKTGKIAIPNNFFIAGDFHEGLAAVVEKSNIFGRKIGYINTAGSYVIQPQFVIHPAHTLYFQWDFHEGLAAEPPPSSFYNMSRLYELYFLLAALILIGGGVFYYRINSRSTK